MTYVVFDNASHDTGHNAGRGCHSAVRFRNTFLYRLSFIDYLKLMFYLFLIRRVLIKVPLQHDVGCELLRF